MQYGVIILAAGQGTRMRSALPKVLHPVGGKPMIAHLLDLAAELDVVSPIVVYGHKGEQLKNTFAVRKVTWVKQNEQLGTGHAVLQTLSHLDDQTTYFILVGDAPLIRQRTLIRLAQAATGTGIAVLTVSMDDPFGYGRIIRRPDEQTVDRIVEEKDANDAEKAVKEINSGVFAIRGNLLKQLLPQIGNDNAQQEYYLTDIVSLANSAGHAVAALMISDSGEVMGCNTKVQLAQLERIYQHRQAEQLMRGGVTVSDPDRIDIRGTLTAGNDCCIDVNCIFEGQVILADNVTIQANCVIKNATIGENTIIKPNTIIEDAIIGRAADIGPFARIRPQTYLSDNTKIGNFVETKNSQIARGAKVNHLSYIGDAIVGENVNVGAGTITCNYDGAFKHQTVIEKDAFIGSNTALVAPVTVGQNATVAAGSTITKNIHQNALGIARGRQNQIDNWYRPKKEKK